MSRPRCRLAIALGLVLAAAGGALAAVPDAATILAAVDAARHPIDEGVIRVRAVVQEEGQPPLPSVLEVYVRGRDQALCVFREGKQKGRKVLTSGKKVWLIVPGTKHAIPISANQRLLGGASVADVSRLCFAEEFVGTVRPAEERVDSVACHVIDLKRKSPAASYASGTLWVGKDDGLARKASFALASGKPAKELVFVAYDREDGKTVLRRMEIRHLLRAERGTLTTLDFLHYEPRPLDDALFDPARARDLP